MVSLYGKCAEDDKPSCRTLVSERVPQLQKALREVAVQLLGEAKPCYLGWGDGSGGDEGASQEEEGAREEKGHEDRRANTNKEDGEGEEVWFKQHAMQHRIEARPSTVRSMALSEMSTTSLIDRWRKCPFDASARQQQVTRCA